MLVKDTDYRITAVFERLVKHIRAALPTGGSLPDNIWQSRHQGIVILLWLHALGIVLFGLIIGAGWEHSLIEGAVLAGIALAASWKKGHRRFRSSMASLGLITASAELVHLSGGYIEAHFHFFVMLGVIVLYQDWIPFLLAIGYVFVHHGLIGVLDPFSVFNHPDALAHPWKWAAIHGGFVLAACIANIVSWRLNEVLRTQNELILNSTGEGIIGLDLQGKISFMNPAAARMLGYKVEELKGRPLGDIFPAAKPDDLSNLENGCQHAQALLQPGVDQSIIEAMFRRKEGTTFLTEYVAAPIRTGSSIVGAVMAFKDITERKQVAEALQKAKDELEIRVAERTAELEEINERLRFELTERQRAEDALAKRAVEFEESNNFLDSIIENIPNILFTKDAQDLRFVRINQAGKELLGLEIDQMIGQNDYDLFPRHEAEAFIAHDRAVLAAGQLVDIPEEPIRTSHKGIRILHTRKVPLFGADGNPKYLLGISEDITERKQAEEALRQNEERTRLIINTALDAAITIDTTGSITDWNTQAEIIFGWSRQEAVGRLLADTIIPSQYREAHQRGLQHYLATGQGPILGQRVEISALHRDGHEFPIELSISPLQLGENIIFSAFVRDISQRKQVQADLMDSEASYRAIANTVPGVIYQFTSRNGVWLVDYVAPQMLEIFGLNAEDVVQDLNNFIKHIYTDDLPFFISSVAEAVEKLTPWNFEGRLINPRTNELVWWQGISTPVSTTSGEVIFNGILLNISGRKQVETALRQSEQRLRQVVSSISDHIYVTEVRDETRINVYVSPHIEPLTGYSIDQFLADWNFWPTTLIHPDDQDAAATQAARLAQGQNSEMEYRLIRANGDTIWVRDSGRVEKDAILQSLIVYGLVSDITERKQAEAALALARDQALEASRLKTELLAKVSHELRTPLGAILGYAELLEVSAYGPLSDKQRQATTKIISSTQDLTNMVSELLDQAQIQAGRLKLNLYSFSPAGLVDDTLAKLSVLARAKNLSLTSDIAPDVPAMLTGDVTRLQQILVNLVSNAIKFTAKGEVRVRLYCPDAYHWALQVSDTGYGIPADAQDYIFEPFRQVDGSITRSHAGTGLGLSIVKQLTLLMGGEITLKSEVERGSTFTISLPLETTKEKVI